MLHHLHSQPTHPGVRGLISDRILLTRRVGGPERARASKALEQFCTVDVRARKSQYYALGALRFLRFGSSFYLTQA